MRRLIPLVAAAALVSAQATAIHDEIARTYNFPPHTLSQTQIAEKSVVLDQFWRRAKEQQPLYIPALRRELADFTNPSFFLYDGSMLLLSLSDTTIDRKAALSAIAHCDLSDLQPNDYFL